MLTIHDPKDRSQTHCDGISRRNFIKVGALGAAGLTLPELLSLEAGAGVRNSTKSVILIYLVGGPPHQDLFDARVGLFSGQAVVLARALVIRLLGLERVCGSELGLLRTHLAGLVRNAVCRIRAPVHLGHGDRGHRARKNKAQGKHQESSKRDPGARPHAAP